MKFVRTITAGDPNFAEYFEKDHPKVVVSDDDGSGGTRLSLMTLAEYQAVANGEHPGYVPEKPKAEVVPKQDKSYKAPKKPHSGK